MSFLIVGGDSLLGPVLAKKLRARGHVVHESTRRLDVSNRLYIDYDRPLPPLPADITDVFLVAAATNYDRCESDPAAWRTNVSSIPRFATALLERRIFVTFISTNAVFGGDFENPRERSPQAPGICYAQQKAQAEQLITRAAYRLNAQNLFSIVRMTKILDCSTAPLPSWFRTWAAGDVVRPFSDLTFAPISTTYAANALASIGEQRIAAALHLSGAANVTYVDLARQLARHLHIDERLIEPTTATENHLRILFKPRYSALDMTQTMELAGVKPQPLESVVTDLVGPERLSQSPYAYFMEAG